MHTRLNHPYGLLLALLLTVLPLPSLPAQPFTDKGKEWRAQEIWRAKELFMQHDLRPLDEAFALRDIDLLLGYYSRANSGQFGNPRSDNPIELAKARLNSEERIALNNEIRDRVLTGLRKLDGLPRFLGDRIEQAATQPMMDLYRRSWFSVLAQMGTEESIVEISRFLFDMRDPDYRPGPRPMIGGTSALAYEAPGALASAIRGKYAISDEVRAKVGMKSDWMFKIWDWWLHSDEAAPYRRKLADAGVVLPPGYPMMEELKGAKTTIASTPPGAPEPWSLKSLEVLKSKPASAPAQAQPEKTDATAKADPEAVNPWLLGTFIVLLMVMVVVLAARKKRGA